MQSIHSNALCYIAIVETAIDVTINRAKLNALLKFLIDLFVYMCSKVTAIKYCKGYYIPSTQITCGTSPV